MRAIVLTEFGGPEVLRLSEVPVRDPEAGEVRIRVARVGVNFMDIGTRKGLNPHASLPEIPGAEGAGVITAVGSGVADLAVGDRVAWYYVPGSYAEELVAPAASMVPVPDEVTDDDAAALLMQGLTAHHLATAIHPIQPGDVALVHAAAGGVGLLLTQLVKARGGRVIARVSTEAKAELVRSAGADDVLVGTDGSFAAQVRELTEGEGVAAVYDGVGATTFADSIASLRRWGVMAYYGHTIQPAPPLDLTSLPNSIFLCFPIVMNHVETRAELNTHSAELFDWLKSGQLRLHIGGRYPLRDAARAHTDLESRATTGKLLLQPPLGSATDER